MWLKAPDLRSESLGREPSQSRRAGRHARFDLVEDIVGMSVSDAFSDAALNLSSVASAHQQPFATPLPRAWQGCGVETIVARRIAVIGRGKEKRRTPMRESSTPMLTDTVMLDVSRSERQIIFVKL